MAIILKLVKGNRELSLNGGRYCVDDNFRPPTAQDVTRGWSFGLHIKSTNLSAASEVHQAFSDIAAMLAMSGDTAEPLQLWYKADDTIPFEPIIGTVGRFSRYTITRGELQAGRQYGVADLRAKVVPQCTLTLTIEPAAEGARQAIGRAYGGVYQDFIGSERGQSKGLIVAPAATNFAPNPVFSNATWDTNWTDVSGDRAVNYDMEYVLFGDASAKIIANDSTPTDDIRFYTSATLSTNTAYVVSFYLKRPDSGVIDANIVELSTAPVAGAETRTAMTFQSLGNGWYLAYATFTSNAVTAAHQFGIRVTNGYTLYMGAAQCEAGTVPTPFFYGDLPGCAWSGTRHASSSTRAAGEYTVNAGLIHTDGTYIAAWIAPRASTAYASGSYYLVDDSVNAMLYDKANNRWAVFGNNIADTFAAGELVVLHATYTANADAAYLNGAAGASGAYSAPGGAASNVIINLGSEDDATDHIGGTIAYFAVYDRALTAAQVAQSYKEIYSAIYNSDPGLLQSPGIPYVWTDDSDFTIDQAQDATRDGYAILSGMPGDLPPEMEYRLTATRASTTAYNAFVGVTPIDYPDIAKITDLKLYDDKSGVVDANASGGEYESVSVTSTSTWASSTAATTFDRPWTVKGQVHVFARLRAATGGIVLKARALLGASSTPQVATAPILITTNTAYRWYYIGSLALQQFDFLERQNQRAAARVQFLKTDTNETVYLDLVAYTVGPLQYQPGAASSAATSKVLILSNQNAAICAASTTTPIDLYTSRGAYARPDPERYNILNVWLAADGGAHVITETVAFDSLYITPRWQIV